MKTLKLNRNSSLNSIVKNNRNLIYQLVLIVVFAIAYFYIFDRKLDMSGDNYNYINYASSILDGKGYSSPYTPENNPTNWYPPGYSSILAFIMFFSGKNIIIFKIFNGLFFVAGILIFNKLVKELTDNSLFAFSISLILILNRGLLMFSTIVMSEPAYLFLTVLTFYWVSKFKNELKFWRSKYFYLIIFSAAAAYYMRSQGIILVGSVAVFFLIKKRWKTSVGFLAGFAILYLPWIIRNAVYGIKGRYLGTIMTFNPWKPQNEQIKTFGELIEKMYINLHDTVVLGFTEVLLPFLNFDEIPKAFLIITGVIILLIIYFGAVKLKRLSNLFIIFISGNIIIFMLWHVGNASRYVWTLAPFITFCFFHGIYIILNLFLKIEKQKLLKFSAYGILLLSFLFIPKLKEMHQSAKSDFPQGHKNYFLLAAKTKWLNKRQIVVACRKPGMFHFYSDTYVTKYIYSKNEEEVIANLIDNKVDFVVLEHLGLNSTSEFLIPAISKYPFLFQEHIFIPDPNTFLLKFDKENAKKIVSASEQ